MSVDDKSQARLLVVALLGLVASNQIEPTEGARDEEAILRHYKPLAMDESWRIINPNDPYGLDDEQYQPSFNTKPGRPGMYSAEDSPSFELGRYGPGNIDEPFETDPGDYYPPSVNSWRGQKNITDTLFSVPEKTDERTGRNLAHLITGTGQPSFIRPKVVLPERRSGVGNSSSKVIATYKFYVPIYIPAVVSTSRRPPLPRLVKETVTEMVPVKTIVPHVKEVLKAEPVHQKVITDFVQASGNSVPSSVDDALKPNEKVLLSVVRNYD